MVVLSLLHLSAPLYGTLADVSREQALCQLDATSWTKLFFSWPLICKGQVWRLATNFFYFGSLDVHFLFHMYFLVRFADLL